MSGPEEANGSFKNKEFKNVWMTFVERGCSGDQCAISIAINSRAVSALWHLEKRGTLLQADPATAILK